MTLNSRVSTAQYTHKHKQNKTKTTKEKGGSDTEP